MVLSTEHGEVRMAFSKRGKHIVRLKKAGLIDQDDVVMLNMGERALRHQKVKLRRERIEMMRELKKDEFGW